MITFERIYTSYENCMRKKAKSTAALQFSFADLIDNLQSIIDDINNRTYVHGRSTCFVNLDPCPREIFAAQFRDRVIQHFFCEEMEAVFDRVLVPTTTSCRKGKGTDYALKTLKKDLLRLTEDGKKDCYYLKFDISGYFMSISRKRLINIMMNLIQREYQGDYKEELLYLTPIIYGNNPALNRIIRGDRSLFNKVPDRKKMNPEGEKGIAIGNITAQMGGNYYLNDFDHYCTDELAVDGYVRYVDDVIILMKNKQRLKEIGELVTAKLKVIGMAVSRKKTILDTVYHGIKFLGKVSFPYGYQRMAKHAAGRLINAAGKMIIDKNLLSRLNSQIGRLRHYSCYGMMHDYLYQLPKTVWKYVYFDEYRLIFRKWRIQLP